ncbi:MAG: hypothetical protein ACP5QU_08185, partial [Anaerolineae bacterium]
VPVGDSSRTTFTQKSRYYPNITRTENTKSCQKLSGWVTIQHVGKYGECRSQSAAWQMVKFICHWREEDD